MGLLLVQKSSSYNCSSHCAVTASVVRAAYSASHVLWAVTVCFFEHHIIGELFMKKNTPDVPLEDKMLPQLLSDEAVRLGVP